MAMDLFCYTSLEVEDVKSAICEIITNNSDLFSNIFHIFEPKIASEINREIAEEYGFNAVSLFLVRLVDKTGIASMDDAAEVIRDVISPDFILILFENETRM